MGAAGVRGGRGEGEEEEEEEDEETSRRPPPAYPTAIHRRLP